MNRLRGAIAAVLSAVSLAAQVPKLARSIALPGVNGRIDHLSFDAKTGRLFVAALGNNTVEVVDAKTGRVLRSLGKFSEPQGVLYVADVDRLYIANGGTGEVRVLDGTTLESVTTLKFADDADNLRYDAAAKQVYVGYGSGALGIIDVAKNAVLGSIPLNGHPESFQLEADGPRIFVNVPRAHTVTIVDRATREKIGDLALGVAAANYPLALDAANHRVFVACRTPARLLVFDTQTRRELARLDLHGDCDDLFFDPARKQLYATCGEGFIDVFTQASPDSYALKAAVKSAPKARTGLFVGDRLFLAAPRQGEAAAQIQVYEFGP